MKRNQRSLLDPEIFNRSIRLYFGASLHMHFYRPQRSCGKLMFLHLSVSHSVHRGEVYPSMHWGKHLRVDTPLGTTPPPGQTAIAVDGTHPNGMHTFKMSVFAYAVSFGYFS